MSAASEMTAGSCRNETPESLAYVPDSTRTLSYSPPGRNRYRLISALIVAVWTFGLVGFADAATPKPWMWTAAQASAAVLAQEDAIYENEGAWIRGGKFTAAKCAGQGKQSAGRYTRFRCRTTWRDRGINAVSEARTVFVKVRRYKAGEACLGYEGAASVPSGCLALNGARAGGYDEASLAMRRYLQQKLGLSFVYQGPTGCVGHGAGFFRCWYGSNVREESGWISVTLTQPPLVRELRPLPG